MEWSVPIHPPQTGQSSFHAGTLVLGTIFGNRYKILALLGQGGMGAVYKANDIEVDRLVALKVIRLELASDPDILHRFKQELILARKVTHKNVIRIFDLGEAQGTKFITMEYIEGQDLKSVVAQKGKLSFEESVRILEQVCLALEAAHAEGVVHRDLKPQNIMLDAHGRAYVMDFGIAHSTEIGGMTMTGAVLGTPDYMSPEQVMGEHVDARSDLFTLGIIFFQLLTGDMPYAAETVQAAMFKRTRDRPRPAIDVDPDIPKFLSDIVAKCMEIDPQLRYQSAREIIHDLRAWQGGSAEGFATIVPPKPAPAPAPRSKWLVAGISAAVVALVFFGVVFRERVLGPASEKQGPMPPAVSLAILPLRNASGDHSLDWLGSSMAEMLSTDVGRSSHLRAVSAERVGQILKDLKISAESTLDAPTIQRLAEFSNADTIVWGQYAKIGDQIRIDATIQDLKRQHASNLTVQANGEKDILAAIDRLAADIRQNLDLSPDLIKELRAQSFKPSSTSLPALRDYDEGLQLARQGTNGEAAKRFEASTKEDPEFALAYSQLAQSFANLGRDDEAEQVSQKALDLSEKLPDQEKYLIQARHDEILKHYDKAIETYETLAKVSPDNADEVFELGRLQESTGAYDKARTNFAKVLTLDPKRVEALLAMGRVEIESGNAQSGLDYLNRAQVMAIEIGNEEEKANILQAFGIAYSVMNKQEDALLNFQKSLKIKKRLGLQKGIADSLQMIATTESTLGQKDPALRDYKEALRIRREIGDKSGIGDVLTDMAQFYDDRGQYSDAMKLYKESLEIQTEAGNEKSRGLTLNNIGITYLQQGDFENARTYLDQSLSVRETLKVPADIADTLNNLAEISVRTAQYDQALSQYMKSLDLRRSTGDKHGAALEFSALGILFGYQGRYGAALSSEEDAVKALQERKEQGFFMTEVLNAYGKAQAQIGKGEDAGKTFDQALALARESKNQAQISQILNNQGDGFFYQGDLNSALLSYHKAQEESARVGDRELTLLIKANIAKLSVKQGGGLAAANNLREIATQADSMGMKYLSVECSMYLAEALLNAKSYQQAREELQRTLGKSEKLGLRALIAQCHYLLARYDRSSGGSRDAGDELEKARRLLDEIHKEAGTDAVLKRSDLSPINL